MKIRTSKPNRKNISVQLLDGVIVAFNQELVGELEDESRIEELMSRDLSISLVEDHMVDRTEEEIYENPLVEGEIIEAEVSDIEDAVDVDSTTMNLDNDEDLGSITEEDVEEYDMDDMTVAELQQLCKDAGLKNKDWKDLRKPELIDFVKKNIE